MCRRADVRTCGRCGYSYARKGSHVHAKRSPKGVLLAGERQRQNTNLRPLLSPCHSLRAARGALGAIGAYQVLQFTEAVQPGRTEGPNIRRTGRFRYRYCCHVWGSTVLARYTCQTFESVNEGQGKYRSLLHALIGSTAHSSRLLLVNSGRESSYLHCRVEFDRDLVLVLRDEESRMWCNHAVSGRFDATGSSQTSGPDRVQVSSVTPPTVTVAVYLP